MNKHLSDKNFELAIKENGNIVIDFWADWCMPCKMLEPILEEVEKELNIKLYKVNVDDYPSLAEKYNILSIPTLLCFKNGSLVGRITGAMSKQRLYSKLKEIFELWRF